MEIIQAAIIKERGVQFTVVIVQQHLFDSQEGCQTTAHAFEPYFPGMPIILMAQDSRGTPSYWGRKDIVSFLSGVALSRFPWKEYKFDV
jgi:hypothetical protein